MVEIKTQETEEVFEIMVDGEIDASSSIHLDGALETAFEQSSKILVDLSALRYISSAGLGVFISKLDDMKNNDVTMVLFGLNDKVSQVFDILGLHQLLTIVEDKEKALIELK